jgi:uncharacterized OB-fold protein
MSQKVPIREGLFTDGCSGALLGSKCKRCNQILPPLAPLCYNCSSEELEKLPLSNRGKLYSYSTVYMQHKHFTAPFVIGCIELPEGIRIFAPVKGWQDKPLKVNMDMELSVEKVWEEDDKEVIAYIYYPV